ncbi:MAG TPA: hypothetical protein VN841_25050 [Bryobacteraceae bacterium]|nr:hypothetical protein [Bryobacteraceae bacterium]
MSDVKPGRWAVPECPINVEYSLVVVDEIRRAVTEGVQKLSRGGIEVGGILYGIREAETVCLLATRPIVCEHARGPAFQFSENDRAALATQLQQSADDPHLAGFTCVGWFVSHTRTGIQLAESDLEIYNSFFPEPWQVTLVVRPGRGMNMRAGFFVREFDGALRTESSYLEFSFPDRLGALFERAPRTDPPAPDRRSVPPPTRAMDTRPGTDIRIDTAASAVPALEAYAAPGAGPELEPEPAPAHSPRYESPPLFAASAAPKKNWVWLVVWALVLAGLSMAAWRYFVPSPQVEPIGLTLAEKDGVLQVQWNHSARPVMAATRGSLQITDGHQARTIPLSAADLASGSFAYQRATGDIEVRLSVESSGGTKVQEGSRYLGTAPPQAKTEDTQALEQRRDQLQQEVDRLRQQNAQQNTRIQQLERTVRILQTRLGQK